MHAREPTNSPVLRQGDRTPSQPPSLNESRVLTQDNTPLPGPTTPKPVLTYPFRAPYPQYPDPPGWPIVKQAGGDPKPYTGNLLRSRLCNASISRLSRTPRSPDQADFLLSLKYTITLSK
jgi:hypothetical protein